MNKLIIMTGCPHLILLLCLTIVSFMSAKAARPPNFHNETGCLYSFMEEGHYLITFPDAENQEGSTQKIEYDKGTNCTNGLYPGNLIVVFRTNDNYMESLNIRFIIKASPSEGYWEVEKAVLKISPVNKQIFPTDVIELKPVDIYAGLSFSYSCNTLVLQDLHPNKDGPHFKLTLRRFQIQPFPETPTVVFSPSYDCSVWLTLPLVTGLILVLFIIFTVMMGVYLLLEQGNQTSDLKFSKQGGMLMNQAQLDATKG